ncbi:MAG TPA: amidohydrolase family protein [Acidimicrobiales bacterium]|nr:amidohydrolase family protein [Acidimicrobiales bacterium]
MADYLAFDADNHYYETRDCFSRHIEAKYADQAIRPIVVDDGRELFFMGDQNLQFPIAWFDGVQIPGAHQIFLTQDNLSPDEIAQSHVEEPPRPEYRDRSARLALMDEQHLEKTLLLPTLGVTWEYEARTNLPALYANLRSFNRWVEDDWGYGADGRIFGVPLISLFDVDEAVKETNRVLDAGAKVLNIRPGPVAGKSVADPMFDPFWSIVNERSIPVAFHICDAGYSDLMSAQWGENPAPNVRKMSPLQLSMFYCDRPIMDTLAACIMHNLFGRFPNVTLLSLEHGRAWVEYLLHAIDHGAKLVNQGEWAFGKIDAKPSEIFRRNIKVAPFPEEDVLGLVELLGAENVLFGSDYPHPEGCVDPWDFADSISSLDDASIRRVMRDNIEELVAGAR